MSIQRALRDLYQLAPIKRLLTKLNYHTIIKLNQDTSYSYLRQPFVSLRRPLQGTCTCFCLLIIYTISYVYVMERFSEVCHAASGPPPPNWSPRTIYGKWCCCRWSPGLTIASMDGSLCRKWSPVENQLISGGYKSWLATAFDNNTMHGRLLQWRVVNE